MFQRVIFLESIKIHHYLEILFKKINKNMKIKIKIKMIIMDNRKISRIIKHYKIKKN